MYIKWLLGMIHVHMNVKDPLSQDDVVSMMSHLQRIIVASVTVNL